jgi:hypothetical protein
VITIERAAIAAALVLATLVLMLLVGTQVLDWGWMLLLAVLGLGIAGYQVRQRLLGHYRVAQILDGRLQLADSLSTAWYLRKQANAGDNLIAQYQLHGAETAAQQVNVADAFPFTGRRLWAIVGGIALVAASLFSLRYFVTNSLSLRHSLIPLQLSEVFERHDKDSEEARRQRDEAKDADEPRNQKNAPKAEGQKDAKDPQRAQQPPMPQGSTPGAGPNPNEPAEMRETSQSPEDQLKQRGDGAAGTAESKNGEKQGDEGEKQEASQKGSKEDDANNPKSSNGLIDKMKEALSSLAAKMRPSSQGKQKSNEQKSGEEKNGDQQSSSNQQGSPEQNASASQDSSEQQQSAQGQQGQTQEKSKAGQGKAADQSADNKKADSHSGIGSQDGDKSNKDADQLKAMGKLAEIIGKRSASATGEVMVENPSGKQRLQTDYSQRVGQHSDLGGEINRDEVPLADQQYVREYMSEVRRQAKHHKASHATTEQQ